MTPRAQGYAAGKLAALAWNEHGNELRGLPHEGQQIAEAAREDCPRKIQDGGRHGVWLYANAAKDKDAFRAWRSGYAVGFYEHAAKGEPLPRESERLATQIEEYVKRRIAERYDNEQIKALHMHLPPSTGGLEHAIARQTRCVCGGPVGSDVIANRHRCPVHSPRSHHLSEPPPTERQTPDFVKAEESGARTFVLCGRHDHAAPGPVVEIETRGRKVFVTAVSSEAAVSQAIAYGLAPGWEITQAIEVET